MTQIIDLIFANVLQKYGKISLEGIGTFSLNKTNAYTERLGRDFSPPKINILFSKVCDEKYDFSKILSNEKTSNCEESYENIEKYINNIKSELENNRNCKILGIGTLRIDDSENIKFEEQADAFLFALPSFEASIIEQKKHNIPKEKRKRKKRVNAWLIMLLFFVLGGVAIWYFIPEFVLDSKEKIFAFFENGENKNDDVNELMNIDTAKNDEISVDKTILDTSEVKDSLANFAEKEIEKPLEQVFVKKEFFVIAGSYTDIAEAEQACNKLKQKGYSEAIVLSSPTEARIRLAYKGFSDKQEALNFLNNTKAVENKQDIWLLRQR